MLSRTGFLALLLALTSIGFVPLNQACGQAQTTDTAKDSKTESSEEAQSMLDEAAALKLSANSPADLAKVIELCEQAIERGLDAGGLRLAKQLIAASAFQRAQAMVQGLPAVAGNARALQRLRQRTMQELEKAVENNPRLAEALILMARLETTPAAAIDHLNKAIELLDDKPVDQSAAYTLRAQLQEDNEEKVADLRLAIKADSTNSDAWQALVLLQFALGKLEEAVEDAKKLLDRDPDNSIALRAAVEALLNLEKADEVIEFLTPRIKAEPQRGDFLRYRALAYRQKSYADGISDEEREAVNELAMQDLNEAIELDHRDAEALVMRGTLYYELGEVEKANRDISDSLLIDPNSFRGVLMRSMVAAREGRFADAIKDMEMLVRADPTNTEWILQLASYYHIDKRPRLAIKLLDQLLEADKDNWRAMRIRGDAKLSVGQHTEAVEDYELAIKTLEEKREVSEDQQAMDIDYSGLLNNLAWVLATSPKDDLRDGPRSVELGLKASEVTNYEAAHILSTLAAGYAEIGDFENARKWAAKAVELGEKEENEQLEQLRKELESYQQDKPWREEQDMEENQKPLVAPSDTIDT